MFSREIKDRLRRFRVGKIHPNQVTLPPELLDSRCEKLGLFGGGVIMQEDISAMGGERQGNGSTNADGAARYQRDLAE